MESRTVAAAVMILCSEMGDKTFFIHAVMAMKHSRAAVMCGALSANTLMCVLSVFLGSAVSLLQKVYTHYLSVFLLVTFGLLMIGEGFSMEKEGCKGRTQVAETQRKKPLMAKSASSVLKETFMLTFLGEWGDRSQVTTIAMAANEGAVAVVLGAVIGHAVCICIAVFGGSMVADKVSVRSVTLFGGVIFLMFAAAGVIMGPDSYAP
ncbi:putative divalent cation/proton antiporter TMEM165 [Ornithodoros turicata]|uniref:putative divalent cation/proton antiporter TMEM165 n=1 Tax=Ornithodoros turicata TaxID=34597 RepID=UPI003139E0F3